MTQRLTDLAGIAEYLSDSERHVKGLVAREAIPYVKVGGKLRFDLRRIDRWIETNTVEVAS